MVPPISSEELFLGNQILRSTLAQIYIKGASFL